MWEIGVLHCIIRKLRLINDSHDSVFSYKICLRSREELLNGVANSSIYTAEAIDYSIVGSYEALMIPRHLTQNLDIIAITEH